MSTMAISIRTLGLLWPELKTTGSGSHISVSEVDACVEYRYPNSLLGPWWQLVCVVIEIIKPLLGSSLSANESAIDYASYRSF